jgi:transposase
MPKKLSNFYRDHIVELYLSGLNNREIAEQEGRDEAWITTVVNQAGVNRSHSQAQRLTWQKGRQAYQLNQSLEKDMDKIIARYLAGESCQSIARQYGVNESLVNCRLRKKGVLRTPAQALLLIDREKAMTRLAKTRTKLTGFGEDTLYQLLTDRGEGPIPQLPLGSKNIDLALEPIAVEVWKASDFPFRSDYCRKRIKYLANRGWSSLYVWITPNLSGVSPLVADEVVRLVQITRANPTSTRQHWVIRSSGKYASIASFDLNHWTFIPSSKRLPHNSPFHESAAG